MILYSQLCTPLQHLRIPFLCDCIFVNQKLVLIGGSHPSDNVLIKTVFIYNFLSAKWSRGADMPTARISPAFSVSPEGLIYVAGGEDEDENGLRGAEVYSVEEDEWKVLPDMNKERKHCLGVFNDGKFVVIDSKLNGDLIERSAEVYDPKGGAWTTIQKGEIPPVFDCVIASSNGARFFSVEKQHEGVMEYDSKKNVWRALCSFPETLGMWNDRVPKITSCGVWRDRIFVSGYAKGSRDDEVFYMLKPLPIGSASGAAKWEAIERPQHSPVDYVQRGILFALTVEI